jgi:3'-phosphoadenosine 5'-phosphosulfate sulfotransferase (PAPS reductase)/FAD synthetase
VVLVANRVAENAARALNMAVSGLSDGRNSANGHGSRTFAPIADWSRDDVWECLAYAGADAV